MYNHDFVIISDAAGDTPVLLAQEMDVVILPMNVTLSDRQLKHYADFREMSFKDFYDALRRGDMASTAAVTPIEWEEAIEKHLSAGKDVLVMPFSSGLSSTYENAVTSVNELRSKYPERQIEVIDTLCVTSGLTLLLKIASQCRADGLSLSETQKHIEDTKHSVCHYFTLEDLGHLRRGGRISATTAVIGSALGIKPILHVDNEGKLINVSKARGRKNSLTALSDFINDLGTDVSEQTIVIAHADCLDETQTFADALQKRFGCREPIIIETGPVIGAHSGPGLILISFLGKNR